MANVPVNVVDFCSFYLLSLPLTIHWMTSISICHLNRGKLVASGLPPFATNFLLNDKTQFQTSSRIITLGDNALFKLKDALMYEYVSESPMNWCNMKL